MPNDKKLILQVNVWRLSKPPYFDVTLENDKGINYLEGLHALSLVEAIVKKTLNQEAAKTLQEMR